MAPPTARARRTPPTRSATRNVIWEYRMAIISTMFTLSMFWRLFSQRVPFFGVPRPPTSVLSTCAVHHANVLENCEDMRIFPGNSPWAILSCDKGRRGWSPTFGMFDMSGPEGELFLWNWRDMPEVEPRPIPFKGVVDVNGTTARDFHPLGVSIVQLDGPKHRVFITNQAKRQAFVEVLDFDLKTLSYEHIQTIQNPRINSPNAIVALDAEHFFVTSDLFFARRWGTGALAEAVLGLPLGEVIYVALTQDDKGVRGSKVQSVVKLSSPSGIEIDRDTSTLYVSSLTSGVYEYKYSHQIKSTGGALGDTLFPLTFKAAGFYRTPFLADNLVLSKDKRLFLSGVYSIEQYYTSMISKTAPKPASWTVELLPRLTKAQLETEVGKTELRLRLLDPANAPLRKEEARWRSVFWDDGKLFGGISTGSVVKFGNGKEGILAVSLVDEGVLICEGEMKKRGWRSLDEKGERQHKEL